ncbi:MAG: hypothetical protein MZV65_35980 [Chromatiales bacterium]|nr:hypothetical protein [Chromatiales bacterium]
MFPHARIHQNLRAQFRDQPEKITDHDHNERVGKQFALQVYIIDTFCLYAFQRRLAIKDGIGKRHLAAGHSRFGVIV